MNNELFSIPQPYKQYLADIQKDYNEAEELIKLAEQISDKVAIPSINELRYAGRRVVDALLALETNSSDFELILRDARFDCQRARHDAIDAMTSAMLNHMKMARETLSANIILKYFPQYPAFLKDLERVRSSIVTSRGHRENREEIYTVIQKDEIAPLLEIYFEFMQSESLMLEIAQNEQREKDDREKENEDLKQINEKNSRRALLRLLLGIPSAILATIAIMALFF